MFFVFLSFILLLWYITLIDFSTLNQLCIPVINPTWSWCVILFISCWVLFASILLSIIESVLIRDIYLQLPCDVFFFFVLLM